MPSETQFRVVVFDVGGVLVELSGLPTLIEWMGNRHTFEQVISMWLTSPVARAFESGQIKPEAFADQLIAEWALPVSGKEFLRLFDSWIVKVLPGAIELVRRVPRNYVRAALCNTNAVHWPCLLKHGALIDAFDHRFPSHLTGKIKPDEEAFQHVLDTLKSAPSEMIFLDDSRLNVEAAKKLGIIAFQVKGPAEAEHALREAGIIAD